MKKERIVVATRKSELALAQCRQFLDRLKQVHPHLLIEELHVVTTGDQITDRALAEIGGKGLFLKEIEEALLDGRADIAVHSLKDMPPELPAGLRIGCIPAREDPRDVLVTQHRTPLSGVERGVALGTSSLRRAVQLGALRPDLQIQPIRGNVGTRLRKCREGTVQVTALALAGLKRLSLAHEADQVLSVEECLPAVGQGALAVEVRSHDSHLIELLSVLQDEETALCTAAERGVMTAVEGDCKTPVAAYAVRQGADLHLRALLASTDGEHLRRREVRVRFPESSGESAEIGLALGRTLREALRDAVAGPPREL